MNPLKSFGDTFERREKNPAENRVGLVGFGVNLMASSVNALISAKQARSETRFGKAMFVSSYEPLIDNESAGPLTMEAPVITAPQAVLPKRETILDDPIVIDQLQFEAMSRDSKTDAAATAGQTTGSDPVEAELQQMITDTVERQLHEKVAELTEAAAKAAMTAGQSYERIAEITQ